MNKSVKKSTIVLLSSLSIFFACSHFLGPKKDTYLVNAQEANTLNVISILDEEVISNRVQLTESQFHYFVSHVENDVRTMVNYTVDASSAVNFTFNHDTDTLICQEITTSNTQFETKIYLNVITPFASSNIKNNVYDDTFIWNKVDDAFVRDNQNNEYFYTQVLQDGKVVKGGCFYTTLEASIEHLDRYGELQFNLTEFESRECRLVLRADDYNKLNVFTDQKNFSGYEAYTIFTTLDNYQSEWLNIGILSYQNTYSFFIEEQYVDTLSLGDMNAHLLIGGADLYSKIRNINTSFDEEVVKAKYQSIYNKHTFGVKKTLLGNGVLDDFVIEDDKITCDLSGLEKRCFGSLTVNNRIIRDSQFILNGIVKMDKTGDTTLGRAGKIEFQIYAPNGDFIKFFIYRYTKETSTFNNSFYVQASNNTLGTHINLTKVKDNCFPIGAGDEHFYALKYEFVYDNGDIYLFLNNELFYTYHSGWSEASLAIGVSGFARGIWSNTNFVNDDILLSHRLQQINTVNETHYFQQNTYSLNGSNSTFIKEPSGYYTKRSNQYNNAFIYDSNDNPVSGDSYYAEFDLYNNNAKEWGQAEIILEHDNTHAYRFVLEKANSGCYQIFKEYKNGTTYWTNYETLLKNDVNTMGNYQVGILVNNNILYFLINGFVRAEYSIPYETHIGLGGKDATIKVRHIESELDTTKVALIESGLEDYVEVSKYENRIKQYEEKYQSYEDGGLLLMGSSSFDFWSTYEEDLPEFDVIYNCGIGGTGITDWKDFMLERLVFAHSPSKIVMFLGGNEINTLSVDEIARRITTTLDIIHQRLPETKIYLLGQKPAVVSMRIRNLYQQLNAKQINIAQQNSEYITYINNWDNYFDDNDVLIRSYFVSDGMHLSSDGYKIWTQNVRKGLGL